MPYSSWQALKYIFTQESFYPQGILYDINEQESSFLDCKHKHMMKSGAPPDKVGVLYHLLPTEFHGLTSRIDLILGDLLQSVFFVVCAPDNIVQSRLVSVTKMAGF